MSMKYLPMKAVIAEYERGDSLPVLGRRYGVDNETIRRRLKAAGVTIRSQREGQRAAYGRHGDLPGLANELGMPEQDVHALLVKYGVLNEPVRDVLAGIDADELDLIKQQYLDGMSCAEISRVSGLKADYVAQRLRDAGVKLRTGRKRGAAWHGKKGSE